MSHSSLDRRDSSGPTSDSERSQGKAGALEQHVQAPSRLSLGTQLADRHEQEQEIRQANLEAIRGWHYLL